MFSGKGLLDPCIKQQSLGFVNEPVLYNSFSVPLVRALVRFQCRSCRSCVKDQYIYNVICPHTRLF